MVSNDDIVCITQNVLSTMLGIEAIPADDCNLNVSHEPITGCIQISGTWCGAVMVQATGDFALSAACKMLEMNPEEVELVDRQDSMAELTNMIGGNVKSLVPGPSTLSLPSVTTGKDFDIRVFGTVVENVVPFECDGQQIRIVLCKGNR